METLILSCGTGGGHNAAGRAVAEELKRRGHHVNMMDPYELSSRKLADMIGNIYIRIAQRTPALFGFIYLLGEGYRRLPFRSPVYFVNKKMTELMEQYLREHPVDFIIMPHLFPAEIITNMKKHGMKVPKTIFIATDYTCIPFTEETECDYYVIPHRQLKDEFVNRGISEKKLLYFGIPTSAAFWKEISKEEAKRRLGLSLEKHYILISGGSIGAGSLEKAINLVCKYLKEQQDTECIVICGNNKYLYTKLTKKRKNYPQMHLIGNTKQMALYMKASDVFLSKPGGLSSTEAAVAGVPLIHISPIPGCETHNRRFFQTRHMCIAVNNMQKRLIRAIEYIRSREVSSKIRKAQWTYVNRNASGDLCDWIEREYVK